MLRPKGWTTSRHLITAGKWTKDNLQRDDALEFGQLPDGTYGIQVIRKRSEHGKTDGDSGTSPLSLLDGLSAERRQIPLRCHADQQAASAGSAKL